MHSEATMKSLHSARSLRSILYFMMIVVINGRPFKRDVSVLLDAVEYLDKYKHLDLDRSQLAHMSDGDDVVVEALKHFQVFAGITVTGKLDSATIRMMNTPRCGNVDPPSKNITRQKGYKLQGSKFAKLDITYRVKSYTNSLSATKVDQTMQRALQLWASVSRLRFTKPSTLASSDVDIDIQFVRGSHGDGNPFDGPGSVLAHAYFPQYGGDAHFDDDEFWTLESFIGSNLLQVAVHEFGHSLGLEHSEVQAAIMAPFYRGYQPNLKLHSDDTTAIQKLYGKPDTTNEVPPPAGDADDEEDEEPSTTLPTTLSSDQSDYCKDAAIDAIGVASNGDTHIFKGNNYFAVDPYGVKSGYPVRISSRWPGLQSGVDAMLVLPAQYERRQQYWRFYNVQTHPERWFIFQGSQVYLYNVKKQLQLGYPKPIRKEFPGVPDNIDAAFVWSRNQRVYFIKGTTYYRFEISRRVGGFQVPGYVPKGYPRSTSVFSGVQGYIQAAAQYKNKRTYFFVKDQYYKINDANLRVVSGYPRSTAEWWFGCPAGLQQSLSELRDPTDNSSATATLTVSCLLLVLSFLINYL